MSALIFEGQRWSWDELERDIQRWAGQLAGCGVREGDRIAVLSPNRPELVALFHAAGRLGAVWAPLNVRLTRAELLPLIERLRPRVILADEALAPQLRGALTFDALALGPAGQPKPVELSPSRTRALLFTSGTTGQPKAVELTEGNFRASARASGANLGTDAAQRWLGCLPLFHIGGLAMVHRCAEYRATLVLQRRFDAAAVARALLEEEITHGSLVPTGLGWVLDALGDRRAPGALRALLVGGGPVSAELLARARTRGFRVLQTYGLTEACSQVCTERDGDEDGSSAGPPLQGLELRIVDDSGCPLGANQVGEIQVRGPTVMRGYLDDPRATAKVLRDGWLSTGDLGSLDAQGRLRVAARRSDLIVSGGENVYPAEIEAVLSDHPAIAEVAVTGIEDAVWGQVPVALWTSRSADAESAEHEDALAEWCRERLAGFKVPRRFVRVQALPRTGSGKVDRGRLRSLMQFSNGKTP